MVKKEIDASLIQQLKDNKISLLAYVSNSSIRQKLRPDLQILQIPEIVPRKLSGTTPSNRCRNMEKLFREDNFKRNQI